MSYEKFRSYCHYYYQEKNSPINFMLDQYIDLLDKAKEILNETLGGYNELDTSKINELKNKVNRLKSIIANYKNNDILVLA